MQPLNLFAPRAGRTLFALTAISLGIWSCQVQGIVPKEVSVGKNTKPNVLKPGTNVAPDGESALGSNPTTGGSTANPAAPSGNNGAALDPIAPVVRPDRSPIVIDAAVAAAFPKGEGFLAGKVIDQFGQPAVNAPVSSELETVRTDAKGEYKVKVPAGPDVFVRFGAEQSDFVFSDQHFAVFPGEVHAHDTQLLSLDRPAAMSKVGNNTVWASTDVNVVLKQTSANRPTTMKSNFGLLQANLDNDLQKAGLSAVYLEAPDGSYDIPNGVDPAKEVRLTWLNPMPRDGKPYGDLYGPLQTYTQWDSVGQKAGSVTDKLVPFTPVNFADINFGRLKVKPGAELKVKWVVGPEVLAQYPINFNNGQAFLPCYTYDDATGWAIPVLATVFQEGGFTWAQYTMRGSSQPTVVPEKS